MAGVSLDTRDGKVLVSAIVSATTTSITAVAATASQYIRVYKLFLVTGGTTNLTFFDGANQLSGALPMVANGSITLDMDGNPWFQTSAGSAFIIGSSGLAVQVSGTVYYTVSPFAG